MPYIRHAGSNNIITHSYCHYCCSVTESCPILCNPLDCSTPGFLVLHPLPEFAQTHVHRVGDAIQPSHPLSPLSPPALSLSQHQGPFPVSQFLTSGGQSIGASASVLPVNLQCWFPLTQHLTQCVCRRGTSLVVQQLRFWSPNTGGLGSIPGWGTRSHIKQLTVWMVQPKIHMPQQRSKSPCASPRAWRSPINKL